MPRPKKHRPQAYRRESVRIWWNERKRSGQMFAYPEALEPNIDYKGNLPWPNYVSLDALYRDYLMHRDSLPMNRFSFAHFFRRASGVAKGQSKNKAVASEGHLLWMKSCVYYDMTYERPI